MEEKIKKIDDMEEKIEKIDDMEKEIEKINDMKEKIEKINDMEEKIELLLTRTKLNSKDLTNLEGKTEHYRVIIILLLKSLVKFYNKLSLCTKPAVTNH